MLFPPNGYIRDKICTRTQKCFPFSAFWLYDARLFTFIYKLRRSLAQIIDNKTSFRLAGTIIQAQRSYVECLWLRQIAMRVHKTLKTQLTRRLRCKFLPLDVSTASKSKLHEQKSELDRSLQLVEVVFIILLGCQCRVHLIIDLSKCPRPVTWGRLEKLLEKNSTIPK